MADSSPPWETYKRALAPLNYGDALWEPAPIYSYKRIKLGDVGYIRDGRFHLLFSAGVPLGTRVLGVDVPHAFQPLDVGHIIHGEVRPAGYLRTSTVKEIGADVGASAAIPCVVEPGAKLAFELGLQQGAALVTKHETYREDIERRFAFERYIKKHYNSWVDFARGHGHDNNPKPVLVTGVDLTRDFAMVAYSHNSVRMECKFSVAVPAVASASVSLWGRWHTEGLVHTNCGPRSPAIEATPSSSSSDHAAPASTVPGEYNQCVFIRYYTMRRRLIPKIIKAGAGPHDLGDPGSDGDLSDFAYIRGSPGENSDDYDVAYNLPPADPDDFDALAEAVFQVSNAEFVVLHHDDLSTLRRFLDNRVKFDSQAKYDLLKRLLIDKDGVGTFPESLYVSSPRSADVKMPTPMPEPQPATDPEFDSDMDSTYNHTGTSETAVEVDAGFPLAWYGGGIPTTPLEHRPRLKLKLPSPPPQGETFMVVFNPYPQYARMEFAEDVERMARWLGSIVHPTYFNAFYYKPSVRNVVIIKVSNGDYTHKLLGEHSWNDILLRPSRGEKIEKSYIFDCAHQIIQEAVWKQIKFKDTWFTARDGGNRTLYSQTEWERIVNKDGVFRVPYPLPTFPIPSLPKMSAEALQVIIWAESISPSADTRTKQKPKLIRGKAEPQTTSRLNGRSLGLTLTGQT